MTADEAPPVELTVMARANLTLAGGISLTVYQVATVPNTEEVQACIAQFLLVPQEPDGGFADLGPVGRPPTVTHGCCGGAKTFRA